MTDYNHALAAMGVSADRIAIFDSPVANACSQFNINTPKRQAAFLAQVAHESGLFRHLIENLNYSDDALRRVWPGRFNDAEARVFARQPERIANKVYADRMGNGSETSGDGFRYIGRGLIQLTGKANYRAAGEGLGIDLISNPELLEQPHDAAMAAGWYWKTNGCNELADADNFKQITRRINGGLNGLDDRVSLWRKATDALKG